MKSWGRRAAWAAAMLALTAGCKSDKDRSGRTDHLEALPYLNYTEDERPEQGVVGGDPDRAQPGLTLVTAPETKEVWLVDLAGEVVRRWRAVPDAIPTFGYARLAPDGSLVVLRFDKGLGKLDADNRVVWMRDDLRAHHEIHVRPDGDIYTAVRGRRDIERGGETLPILDDRIVRLDAAGKTEWELSLYDALGERITDEQIARLKKHVAQGGVIEQSFERDQYRGTPYDVFHLNSIQVLDRELPGIAPAGSLLICVRNLNLIGIVDPEAGELVWELEGVAVQEPHHPRLLDSGTILLFDNGVRRGASRVIEVQPASGEVVWQYPKRPHREFFSAKRGSSQRLPNGNTLIAESDRGRVIEVTAGGEIVWEYLMPRIDDKKREAVYRAHRVLR